MFAVTGLFHLGLPDFEQPGWTPPLLLHGLGCLILLKRPSVAGFAISMIAILWPLIFLRDVLTQSMLMLFMSVGGLIACIRPSFSATDAARVLGAFTYFLAVLHKLNTDFLNPDISCANHALDVIKAHWIGMDWTWIPAPALPWFAIIVEGTLGVFLLRGSLLVWPLGFLFHLPLTVTLAPAFGAVMFGTYAAAMSKRNWWRMKRAWRRHHRLMIASAVAFFVIQAALEGGVSIALPWIQSMLGWVLSMMALMAWSASRRSSRPAFRPVRKVAWVMGLAWGLHGLTPYLGIQYQHTAAMLSNLRIDRPCRNSMVMPYAPREFDPYIRIDVARIGSGLRPERERVLVSQLWSVPALAAMHRNWCVPHLRPIYLSGTVESVAWTIPDLCHSDWVQHLPPQNWPTGFQRFQKNLLRQCEAPCIH
ncbi:MAG: hypothetical protein VX589_04600 [Myxococcota bacterium]|nr:hypothetical protein [Myxococcota bacterium]